MYYENVTQKYAENAKGNYLECFGKWWTIGDPHFQSLYMSLGLCCYFLLYSPQEQMLV